MATVTFTKGNLLVERVGAPPGAVGLAKVNRLVDIRTDNGEVRVLKVNLLVETEEVPAVTLRPRISWIM